MAINWDDTQKFTQAINEMYNISLFDDKQMMEWEEKEDVNKTWGARNMFLRSTMSLKTATATQGQAGWDPRAR